MVRKNRIVMIQESLIKMRSFCKIKTQELRIRLIDELERLFLYAQEKARTAENREVW
ncbi:MAG: hypothetical protein ACP5JW_07245 [Candidatus Bathyarchaeia archaeon]